MVKKMAFINSKGGVGKTTSVYNIANLLAHKDGVKVLVIDADKQCNTTDTFLSLNEESEISPNTFFEFLLGADGESCVTKTKAKVRDNAKAKYYGVDVMRAKVDLGNERALNEIDYNDLVNRYNKLIEDGGYEWVLVDMPPSNVKLNNAVFGCLVDYVIAPMGTHSYSITGYSQMMDEVEEARKFNGKLQILGFYLSDYNALWGCDNQIKDVVKGFNGFIDVQLPHACIIKESTMYGIPVCFNRAITDKPAIKARKAFENLVGAIKERIAKIDNTVVRR